MRRLAVAALAALALSGCQPEAPPPPSDGLTLTPARFDQLAGWAEDRVADAMPALLRSCKVFLARPADKPVTPVAGTNGDWRAPCQAAQAVPPGDHQAARAFLETWFRPWRAYTGDTAEGLFTGYYEAELRAATTPDSRYRHPLYARPADLVTVDLSRFGAEGPGLVGRVDNGRLVPYFTRAEIDAGAARPPVLLWAEDPVDVLLLHIQGSGRVLLRDGGERRVGFAISNGHKFVGIGKTLLDKGKISRDNGSMQAVTAWLRTHPDEAPALIAENPRYIFFRDLGSDGPEGAMGVVLTAGRSIAVDPRHVPLGVPLWLDTTDPDGAPLRRLMLAQDTGSAIKGPVRGDFFWGSGAAAFDKAGRMKSRGGYWLLLPRSVNPIDALTIAARVAS